MARHFRGKPFTVTYRRAMPKSERDCLGMTEYRGNGGRIRILAALSGRSRLETEIHESMHACLPDLDESAVSESARDIARFLWDIGYRLTPRTP